MQMEELFLQKKREIENILKIPLHWRQFAMMEERKFILR